MREEHGNNGANAELGHGASAQSVEAVDNSHFAHSAARSMSSNQKMIRRLIEGKLCEHLLRKADLQLLSTFPKVKDY